MFRIEDYEWPCMEGRTPFSHQKDTAFFAIKNPRCFILNEMGTGKTLSVLWATDILLRAGRIRKVLIVGPLSTLESVWKREIFFNLTHRRCSIAHGNHAKRVAAIKANVQYVIINHDGIKTCLNEIINEGFDVVIIDELTAFKADNDRTRVAIYLGDRSNKAVWGMTGEITPNSPTEAYTQIKVVKGSEKEKNKLPFFGQFRDATCYLADADSGLWLPKGGEGAALLSQWIQPAIRWERKDCIDLPETFNYPIEVEMSKEQEAAYKEMKRKLILDTESGLVTSANAAVKLNKLLQISAGSVKTDDGLIHQVDCSPSLNKLYEIFEQTPQRKLVVFAAFRATIELLVSSFRARGVSAECIYGGINSADRASSIERFERGNLSVLVLQPQSSAHGITLVAASTVVWFSLVPSGEFYNQGNARIVRPGQTRQTFILNLIRSSADQHIYSILKRKNVSSQELLELFSQRLF